MTIEAAKGIRPTQQVRHTGTGALGYVTHVYYSVDPSGYLVEVRVAWGSLQATSEMCMLKDLELVGEM